MDQLSCCHAWRHRKQVYIILNTGYDYFRYTEKPFIFLIYLLCLYFYRPIQNQNSFFWLLRNNCMLASMQISTAFTLSTTRKCCHLLLSPDRFAAKHKYIFRETVGFVNHFELSRQLVDKNHDLCTTKSVSPLVLTIERYIGNPQVSLIVMAT